MVAMLVVVVVGGVVMLVGEARGAAISTWLLRINVQARQRVAGHSPKLNVVQQ